MEKHQRFQLIAPIVGNKIYQTNSFQKGAGKCFEELKGCEKNDFNQFTIMNVDNFETYKFGISKREKHNTSGAGGSGIQRGGSNNIQSAGRVDNSLVIPSGEIIGNEVRQMSHIIDDTKIVRLEKAVVALSDKIVSLEEQIEKINKSIAHDKELQSCEIKKKVVSEPNTCSDKPPVCAIPKELPPSTKDVYKTNLSKLEKVQKSVAEDF